MRRSNQQGVDRIRRLEGSVWKTCGRDCMIHVSHVLSARNLEAWGELRRVRGVNGG